RKQAGKRYLETKDGFYIAEDEASVAERRKTPWEVTHDFSPQNKWVHIRVNSGTLTLYEGDKAVFTTLMSPGKEGATPYGRYWIESKEQVSTMTTEMGEPRKFWIADVPWTQYFERPYAIHAAYWHEDFGERKSGGCVNLSPIDAKRVFDWTVPAFNEKWGMVQGRGMGHSTFILVEG
ncbi:MAG: L,D-transpeptidase, partial [Polyangiaceae bacterium]